MCDWDVFFRQTDQLTAESSGNVQQVLRLIRLVYERVNKLEILHHDIWDCFVGGNVKLMCFNQEIVQNDRISDSKILIFNKDSYDQVSPLVWLAAELAVPVRVFLDPADFQFPAKPRDERDFLHVVFLL